ncbi:MAG: histidine kinase [Bacteroidia bacterium]|nr:histidine kinase [Bacteroidia bacterium]
MKTIKSILNFKKSLWFILFLLVVNICTYAQSPVYKHYSVADGLPSSEVYHVFQDSKGYIWFATVNGVSRFDGYEFKNFSYENGLPDNSVFEIYEDYKGRIWFIPYSFKLSYFENDTIHEYKYNDKFISQFKIYASPAKRGLYIDKKDNLYISDILNGIFKISNNGICKKIVCKTAGMVYIIDNKPLFKVTYVNNNEISVIRSNKITGSIETNDFYPNQITPQVQLYGNKIYLTSDKHLTVLENDCFKQKFEFKSTIYWMCFDNTKKLWMGFADKGACYFEDGNLNKCSDIKFLPGKSVTSVLTDKENGIWFTTINDGVYYLPSLFFLSYTLKDGLTSNYAGAIAASHDTLWAGLNGGNIIRISSKSKKLFNIKKEQQFYSMVYSSNSGNLYFGGRYSAGVISKDLINQYRNDHPSYSNTPDLWLSCRNILLTGENSFWFGYYNNLAHIENGHLTYHSNANDNTQMRVGALCLDNDSTLWIGSYKGLWKYIKPKSGISGGDYIYFGDKNPLLKTRILDIKKDKEGTFWIATKEMGIIVYNKDTIYQITTKNGLSTNTVSKLLIDKNTVWAGTNNGLNKITINVGNNKKFTIQKITTTSGLVSNEINDLAMSGSIIYVATPEGITFFDSNNIKPNTSFPPIVIKSIKINFHDTLILNNYELSHNYNNIEINFAGLSFHNAGKIFYKYKMTGAGNEFNFTTSPTVQYPALTPGNYSFEVYAANEEGNWNNKPLRIQFIIKPPFYNTWWFIVISILVLITIIWMAFVTRLKRIREKNKTRNSLYQYMLKALGQQMNPHFIFNSLNSLQYYILQNDKTKSSSYLEKFASLMRLILDNSQEQLILLSNELKAVELYLELEQIRFKEKFDFVINAKEEDTLNYKIAPLLLQPFVENAIHHGFLTKEDKGLLTITIEKKEQVLHCIIEDNGIGREASEALKAGRVIKRRSLGTRITATRIGIINNLYGTEMTVKYIDLKSHDGKAIGTRVEILIPILAQ